MIIRSNAVVSYRLETQICLSLISPRCENESKQKLKPEIHWPITLNVIIFIVKSNQME